MDGARTERHDDRATAAPAGTGLVLLVACVAEFMVVLDASVVNVALPAIAAGLGFSPAGLQWVVTGYVLVFAGFLLLGGRLADLYGRRRVFLAGLVVFVLASVAGGLATTPGVLVAARAVQALGAAVLAPASLTLVTTSFAEGSRRVRAIAIWTAVASSAGAAGSLLGGVLTEYLTWRATLLVNLPVGAVALVVALRVLSPEPPAGADRAARPRPDVPGAAAVTVGLVALTFAVSGTASRGWTSPVTLGALGVAVAGLGLFVACEGRSRSPLVPLRLFGLRAVSVGNVAALLAGACLMPMWFFLTLAMAQVLGLSAVLTGLGFLPHTLITVAVGARVAPRLMRRVPARVLLGAGSLVAAAGFWWQSLLAPGDTYLGAVLGPAVLISVGTGLLNTPLSTLVTSGVTDRDAGAASGLMNTSKQVGGAVGLAALSTLALSVGPGAGFAAAFEVMALLMVGVAVLSAALPRPAPRPRPMPRPRSAPVDGGPRPG